MKPNNLLGVALLFSLFFGCAHETYVFHQDIQKIGYERGLREQRDAHPRACGSEVEAAVRIWSSARDDVGLPEVKKSESLLIVWVALPREEAEIRVSYGYEPDAGRVFVNLALVSRARVDEEAVLVIAQKYALGELQDSLVLAAKC